MDYIGIIKQRKIISGKLYHRYFIDSAGKEIGIPAGIYCYTGGPRQLYEFVTNIGLKRQFPDAVTFTFSYNNKQTQEKAIKDMIAACSTLTRGTNKTCVGLGRKKNRLVINNEEIDSGELPHGVTFHDYINNGTPCKLFAVSYFYPKKNTFSTKVVYIGTENTWRQNYAKALKKAIALREESLELYNKLTTATK